MDSKKPKKYSDLTKLIAATSGIGLVVFGIMFIIVFSIFSSKGGNSAYKYTQEADVKVSAESGNKVEVLGVIQDIDLSNNEIIVTNIDKPDEENLKLKLVGYTNIKDEYDELMVVAQIELGDIADIRYAQESKKVEEIKLSGKAWKIQNVKNVDISQNNKKINVDNKEYKFNNKLVKVYKTDRILFDDIQEDAVLTLKGYKDIVWSVKVEKYYGYLTFTNHQGFIGADIEVDTDVFKKLDVKNKILLSPGEHKIVIKRDDIEAQIKYAIIKEKETTTVDLSDIEMKRGTINFDINVDDYLINISNEDKSYDMNFRGTEIAVIYGKYKVEVSKLGYKTYTKTIDVKSDVVNLKVSLQRMTGTTDSGQKSSIVKITSNIVRSEVYVNDKYIGTAPLETEIPYGSHKISVRRQGYTSATKQVNINASLYTYDFRLEQSNPYSNSNSGSSRDDVY